MKIFDRMMQRMHRRWIRKDLLAILKWINRDNAKTMTDAQLQSIVDSYFPADIYAPPAASIQHFSVLIMMPKSRSIYPNADAKLLARVVHVTCNSAYDAPLAAQIKLAHLYFFNFGVIHSPHEFEVISVLNGQCEPVGQFSYQVVLP